MESSPEKSSLPPGRAAFFAAESRGGPGQGKKFTFMKPFAEKRVAKVDFSMRKVYNKREKFQAERKTDHGTEKAET